MIKIIVVEKLTDKTILQTTVCPEQYNSIIERYTEIFPGKYYEIIIAKHEEHLNEEGDSTDIKRIISRILKPLWFFVIPLLNIVLIYILVHSADVFSISLIIILTVIMIMGGILIVRSGD
ncbi:MAG: hypothetical protein R6U31_05395 [bacterium]